MKFFRSKRDSILNQAISSLHEDLPDAKTLSASAERVWQSLQTSGSEEAAASTLQVIRGCADIRTLLPLFYKKELTEARALIVEDHLRECVACRSYVSGRGMESGTAVSWQIDSASRGFQWSLARLAFAGAALAVLVAMVWAGGYWYFGELPGSRAQVVSLVGQAYRVSVDGVRPLTRGDAVGPGEFVRTGAGSHASLELFDGSEVEMNQRAEFSVTANRRITSIHLDQGSIMVHAAKRHTGHLYVSAPDCTVAVTGTLFAVNSGIKGSRVTVIEGEVHVKHSGQESILHSGDQVATTQTIGLVPVREEIAWSQDLDHELALLAEFSKLREKLNEIPAPAPRYESKILPLLPADTVLYIGIPNLGETLEQANQIFQQQLSQSPILQQWWNQNEKSRRGPSLDELIGTIRTLSQYLGDEVVVTMASSSPYRESGPVLLAEVRQAGLTDFLHNHFASTLATEQGTPNVRVVDSPSLSSIPDGGHAMIMLVRPNMLVVGGDAASVRRMNAQLESGAKLFSDTDLGQRILGVYGRGAETLVGVNLGEILKSAHQDNPKVFEKSGFNNLRYLIATRAETRNQGNNRLTLEFQGERRGMASWLAAPSPMGSLDYVSANAGAALSFVTKQPALMLDDLASTFGASDPNFSKDLADTNAKLGLDIRNDVANALGGEVTLALDGPVLPTPSWKVIVEVNNSGALQLAIERLLADARREAQGSNEAVSLTLDQQQAGGRTFYRINAQGPGLTSEYDYTFVDGYMIMAPSRALLLAALETHANGTTLARSPSLRSLLPSDNQANFSGMLYQNLSPILKPLAAQLTSQQFALVQQLAADSKPSVMCAYGESDRIEVVANGKLLDLNPGIMTLFQLLGVSQHGTSARGKT